jgi:amidase
MTKNVVDNAILLHAMKGEDPLDPSSVKTSMDDFQNGFDDTLEGIKLGVLKSLLTDSIYASTVEKLKKAGVEMVEITPPEISFKGFITLLNIDMKHDLPKYLADYAANAILIKDVKSVLDFNNEEAELRAPYGQQLFEGIVKDATTLTELEGIKNNLKLEGEKYLIALEEQQLDAILSIDNYHSGIAAVAKYPTLTVPMGYQKTKEPISLTFIGRPFTEQRLLEIGHAFEQLTQVRKSPKNYQ